MEIKLLNPIQNTLSQQNLTELKSIEPWRFFPTEKVHELDCSLMSFEFFDAPSLLGGKHLMVHCLSSTTRWIAENAHNINYDSHSPVREWEKEFRIKMLTISGFTTESLWPQHPRNKVNPTTILLPQSLLQMGQKK